MEFVDLAGGIKEGKLKISTKALRFAGCVTGQPVRERFKDTEHDLCLL